MSFPPIFFIPGNWSAGGWQVQPAEWYCQPTEGEGTAGVHSGCPPAHLQNPLRAGHWFPHCFHFSNPPLPLHWGILSASDLHPSSVHYRFQPANLHLDLQLDLLQQPDPVHHHHRLQQHSQDDRPGHLCPGGVSGSAGQDRDKDSAFSPRGWSVHYPVHNSGLGAPLHLSQQYWVWAPVHAPGDRNASMHHLHILLRVHLPRSRDPAHLWCRPQEGKQQQWPVLRLPQLTNPAGPLKDSSETIKLPIKHIELICEIDVQIIGLWNGLVPGSKLFMILFAFIYTCLL